MEKWNNICNGQNLHGLQKIKDLKIILTVFRQKGGQRKTMQIHPVMKSGWEIKEWCYLDDNSATGKWTFPFVSITCNQSSNFYLTALQDTHTYMNLSTIIALRPGLSVRYRSQEYEGHSACIRACIYCARNTYTHHMSYHNRSPVHSTCFLLVASLFPLIENGNRNVQTPKDGRRHGNQED